MALLGVHHIALICADYQRSRHFYTDILQAEVIAETWRAERQSWKLDLQLGDCQLELFSFPAPPTRPSHPEACGLRHLALRSDDLDADIRDLNGRGVATEAVRVDELTGRRFTFFQDPDGLPLELYEV